MLCIFLLLSQAVTVVTRCGAPQGSIDTKPLTLSTCPFLWLCSHGHPRAELLLELGGSWRDIPKKEWRDLLAGHLPGLPGGGRVVLIYRFTQNPGEPL